MTLTDFLNQSVTMGLQALATAVAGLVVALLVQLLRKLNLTLQETQEARIRQYAQEAALAAETKIEGMIKTGLLRVGVEEKAKAKLHEAVNYLVAKAPWVTLFAAQEQIEAELMRVGLGAAAKAIPGFPQAPQAGQ